MRFERGGRAASFLYPKAQCGLAPTAAEHHIGNQRDMQTCPAGHQTRRDVDGPGDSLCGTWQSRTTPFDGVKQPAQRDKRQRTKTSLNDADEDDGFHDQPPVSFLEGAKALPQLHDARADHVYCRASAAT
jgi:hypothetical protein